MSCRAWHRECIEAWGGGAVQELNNDLSKWQMNVTTGFTSRRVVEVYEKIIKTLCGCIVRNHALNGDLNRGLKMELLRKVLISIKLAHP